jgi:hypothetical protein
MTLPIALVICVFIIAVSGLCALYLLHVVLPVSKQKLDILAKDTESKTKHYEPQVSKTDFDELKSRVNTLSAMAGFNKKR